MYLYSKGSKEQIRRFGNILLLEATVQNPIQQPGVSSPEIENTAAPDLGARSCTKGLSQASGQSIGNTVIPAAKSDARAKAKPWICFEVALSGNGYDYLGP
jgi:hypothetical protein